MRNLHELVSLYVMENIQMVAAGVVGWDVDGASRSQMVRGVS